MRDMRIRAVFPWFYLMCVGATQACELTSNRGQLDFGNVTRGPSVYQQSLPAQYLSLDLRCKEEQELYLAYRAEGEQGRGFLFANLGHYRLEASDALLDGRPVQLQLETELRSGGLGAQPLPVLGRLMITDGVAPMRGRHLSLKIKIEATLDAASAEHDSRWETQGSFELAGKQVGLRLAGQLTPASCLPSLTAGGRADFGAIAARDLAWDRVTSRTRRLMLSVRCAGPTRFALRTVDNLPGSVHTAIERPAGTVFGLRGKANGKSTGGVVFHLLPADPSMTAWLSQDASTWEVLSAPTLRSDQHLVAFSGEHCAVPGPNPLAALEVALNTELMLAPAARLDLREVLQFEGSATIEIVYL